MAWWKKTLAVSVVWAALIIGAGMLHTNVILAGRLTPQQDDRISTLYGMACGAGLVLTWFVGYVWSKRADRSG